MTLKKLWETPKNSWNGCSDISFEFDGLTAKLLIKYDDFNDSIEIHIYFSHCRCYRHETNYLFMPGSGAYECLCEVENSDWLKSLKDFNPEYPINNFKHFILENQNDGRFEVIAENYSIVEQVL